MKVRQIPVLKQKELAGPNSSCDAACRPAFQAIIEALHQQMQQHVASEKAAAAAASAATARGVSPFGAMSNLMKVRAPEAHHHATVHYRIIRLTNGLRAYVSASSRCLGVSLLKLFTDIAACQGTTLLCKVRFALVQCLAADAKQVEQFGQRGHSSSGGRSSPAFSFCDVTGCRRQAIPAPKLHG